MDFASSLRNALNSINYEPSMPQQFIDQLERVCRRRNVRRRVTAICWVAALVVTIGFVLAGLDRLLGVADPVGRSLLTLVFLVASVWIARKYVAQANQHVATPLQLAHEIERRHPAWRDLVANGWQFATQTDEQPTAGSASLRRAVVLRAAAATEDLDWDRLVPRQPLQRSAITLLAVAAVALSVGLLAPQATRIGLARLINPLSDAEWPHEHDLQFVDPPHLLAAGDDLVLQLRDSSGTLPSEVTVTFRSNRQGRWQQQEQQLRTTGELLEIRRANVQQALEFRASGGDHRSMPWHSLEIVPPPQVEELALTVHPPAYSGLESQPWESNREIIAGSRLSLRARADQQLTEVVLKSEKGRELPAVLEPDGRSFCIDRQAWKVSERNRYTLHMTTATGITSVAKESIALSVVPDLPPAVRLVQPTEDLEVVPAAKLSLVVEAVDALAVREVKLVYLRSDRSDAGEQSIPLWQASSNQRDTSSPSSKRVEFLFDLQPLALATGTLIELRAQAIDAQPAVGQSPRALRLTVLSEEELWSRILDRQAELVALLTDLLDEQNELASLTRAWAELPDWTPGRWMSASHAALYRQRQLIDLLSIGQGSAKQQLSELLTAIERNQLTRPDAVARLQRAAGDLQRLTDGPLANVESSLREFVRQAQRTSESSQLADPIDRILTQQRSAIEGLQDIVQRLVPGDELGRLQQALADLEADQRQLVEHCRRDIATRLVGLNQIQPDVQELLDEATREQRELARRLAEIVFDMQRTAQRIADSEPLLALRVDETIALAREFSIQSKLQTAADHLRRRRLGSAASRQDEVIDALAKLRDRLSGRDTASEVAKLEQLRSAERTLARLRRQTAALEEQLRKRPRDSRELAKLRREREQLAEKADRLVRRLQRLRVARAAESVRRAAQQLRQATLDRPTAKQARQQLDEAQRALTEARRRQQVRLARLQMAQLEAKLRMLVTQQQAVRQEFARLANLQQQSSTLNDAQLQSVRQLASRQGMLREDVIAEAEQLESLPVFTFMLNQAAATMERVGQRLERTELQKGTELLVDQAIDQLQQVASAVRREQQGLADSQQSGAGGEEDQQTGDTPQAETLQLALGQLKLLKSLQANLREQTVAFEQALAANEPTKETADDLARQQRQLTELAGQLVPEPADPPTEELLPSLEQELKKSLDEKLFP